MPHARGRSTRRRRASTTPGWLQALARRRCRIRRSTAAEGVRHGRRGRVRQGPRVLGWDVWNEPDNTNTAATRSRSRRTRSISCWRCCRRCSRGRARPAPTQPLTSRRVEGRLVADDKLSPMERIQLEQLGRDLVPQLRQRRRVREADRVAAALPSADHLHGIHGARQRQHVPGLAAASRRGTTWPRSTGASSPARRRRTCRGTRGRQPYVSTASRRCGSTKCFTRTGRPIAIPRFRADSAVNGQGYLGRS